MDWGQELEAGLNMEKFQKSLAEQLPLYNGTFLGLSHPGFTDQSYNFQRLHDIHPFNK